MKKKLKYFFIVLFAIVYILVLFVKDGFVYDFFISTFSILSALSVYFYNDSITIFKWYNEIVNKFIKKPQVTWECDYSVSCKEEDCFKTAKKELDDFLNEDQYSNTIKILDKTYNKYTLLIENPDIKQYSVEKLNVEEELFELHFYYKCNLRYKESKTEFNNSITLFNDLTKKIAILSKNEDEFLSDTTPLYTVKISMSKMNPFFGLTTKRLNKESTRNTELSFEQEGAKIKSSDNIMTITSNSQEKIKKVTREYIALSVAN
ncbi:hypothetical protein K4U78_11195 [Staphylococcus epidermidis]|nr:hypothetical protein [Staphylococcus epidermidis]